MKFLGDYSYGVVVYRILSVFLNVGYCYCAHSKSTTVLTLYWDNGSGIAVIDNELV